MVKLTFTLILGTWAATFVLALDAGIGSIVAAVLSFVSAVAVASIQAFVVVRRGRNEEADRLRKENSRLRRELKAKSATA